MIEKIVENLQKSFHEYVILEKMMLIEKKDAGNLPEWQGCLASL